MDSVRTPLLDNTVITADGGIAEQDMASVLSMPWWKMGVSRPSKTQLLVASMYKDEAGNPILLSNGQDQIFQAIFRKKYNRLQVMCYTQYGKSLTIALAVLTRCLLYPEKWAITAEKEDKAGIIQSYVIGHIFDNDVGRKAFVRLKGERDEDIMRSRNKKHTTFRLGKGLMSEIFICTAKEALGKGAPNVVEDESAFVEDTDQALIMRMLGGGTADDDGTKGFLCKVGNPFRRNHFLRTHLDPRYHKIVITGEQGIVEGRITREYLDEMKSYAYYKILYDCEFPNAQDMDDSGWMYLVDDATLHAAVARTHEIGGRRLLGVDVARGGRNYNAYVLRTDNYARVVAKTNENDLMQVAANVMKYAKECNVAPDDVFVDANGLGAGVVDRLKEAGFMVNGIMEGGKSEEEGFLNVRALMYAGKDGLANWLKRGGRLEAHKDWSEMLEIRFRPNNNSKTVIESKDDMRKRGIQSPDVIDALALTFAPKTVTAFYMPSTFGGVVPMDSRLGILT